jgi:glycosyltransferase involved in cell wall biosynthesis
LAFKGMIAISNFSDFIGGGEYSFFDIIYHINNWFHPVVVASKSGTLVDRFKENKIATQVIHLSKIRPWLLPGVLKTIRTLTKATRKAKASIIYANGSRPAFYGGIVGRLLNIPVIWHCRIAEKDPFFDLLLTKLSRLIIVNSLATGRRFSKKTQDKIRVIYNGIDTKWLNDKSVRRAPAKEPGGKILLVVGRVSKVKRHDLAISAFEETAGFYPDLQLVIVGAKDPNELEWWNYLQKRTADSPYAERIDWRGHVEDVRPWYRAASLLLLPSDNESFGRVLVEAMACQIPVVATRVGGIPEIVRHGKDGILVPTDASRKLTDAILQLLKDDHLRRKMGRFGIQRAKAFDLETHLRAISEAFKEAMETKKTIGSRHAFRAFYGSKHCGSKAIKSFSKIIP